MAERIQLIEELSAYILYAPEARIIHLSTYFHLLDAKNATLIALSLCSLFGVFKNVCPLYLINKPEKQKALANPQNKQERSIINFELQLVEFYEKYIQTLQEYLKLKSYSPKDSKNSKYSEEDKVKIVQTSVLCLSNCLIYFYHFNLAPVITKSLAREFFTKNEKINKNAYKSLEKILSDQNPLLYQLKYVCLKEIGDKIDKLPESKWPDNTVELVNTLWLDTNAFQNLQDLVKSKSQMQSDKKKKIIQMEKDKKEGGYKNAKSKQKKRIKEMKEITKKQEQPKVQIAAGQRQYKEALKQIEKQQAPVKTLASQNSNLLQKLFYIYFKILKAQKISKFFQSAMDGILKYVHLISIDLILGIIVQLKETCIILREQSLQNQESEQKEKALKLRVSTIYTVNEIIEGPGQAFDLDDKDISIRKVTYIAFYNFFFQDKLITFFKTEIQQIVIKLLEKLFLLKRVAASEIAASYLKASLQLLKVLISKQNCKGFIYAILTYSAKLIMKYPKLSQMFDDDNEGFGLDAYCEQLKDPSLTNAINSCINPEIKYIVQLTKDKEIQKILTKLQSSQTILISYISQDLAAIFKKYSE